MVLIDWINTSDTQCNDTQHNTPLALLDFSDAECRIFLYIEDSYANCNLLSVLKLAIVLLSLCWQSFSEWHYTDCLFA